MPTRLAALLLTAAIALAAPAAAAAVVPASKLLQTQPGSPLASVASMNTVPPGWRSSPRQAVAAAKNTVMMRTLHRRLHPLRVYAFVWRAIHPHWYVMFLYRQKVVAAADVTPAGKVTHVWTGPQASAPYAQGKQPAILSSWMVLLPTSLLFLLPFLDPTRLCRIAHLDGLAVLAFLVSFLLLAGAHLEAAIWLAYPPLIYLLVRLLRAGFGRSHRQGRLAPLLGMRTLVVGLPLLLGVRIAISLLGHHEIDVGYQSVIGAHRMAHHLPLYWNDPYHGDTYGPIAYLAYLPFELLFPWTNSGGNLHAADAAAIFFDLGTIAGLVVLGRRLLSGRDGMRLGLVLAWAWAACPFTVIALIVHTNDGLISMLTVFALVALRSSVASGTLLGLAAAAKFSPAALLPLVAAPRQRGPKGVVVCVGAFVAVVAIAISAWLPSAGLSYFWKRTIGYQFSRPDVFSPWALHPALHPFQILIGVLAVLLAGAVALVPQERPLSRVCALTGAVMIAIQLPATHWYYYYVMWFLPFALVALLGGTEAPRRAPADEAMPREWKIAPREGEPALVGA